MSVTTNINPLIPEKVMAQPLVKPVTKTAKTAVSTSTQYALDNSLPALA